MSQDEYTLAAYIIVSIAVRSAATCVALLVCACIAYTASYADFETYKDDTYIFLIFGTVYLICAKLIKKLNDITWVGCMLMAAYCYIYSFDSWISKGYETWLHQYHEGFILAAHVLIMLLLSAPLVTMVLSRLYLFRNSNCSHQGS